MSRLTFVWLVKSGCPYIMKVTQVHMITSLKYFEPLKCEASLTILRYVRQIHSMKQLFLSPDQPKTENTDMPVKHLHKRVTNVKKKEMKILLIQTKKLSQKREFTLYLCLKKWLLSKLPTQFFIG
jgi:hypothetical protein